MSTLTLTDTNNLILSICCIYLISVLNNATKMPSFERTTTREASVSPTGVNDSKDEELGKFCVVECT